MVLETREDSVYLAKLAEQAERYEGPFNLPRGVVLSYQNQQRWLRI